MKKHAASPTSIVLLAAMLVANSLHGTRHVQCNLVAFASARTSPPATNPYLRAVLISYSSFFAPDSSSVSNRQKRNTTADEKRTFSTSKLGFVRRVSASLLYSRDEDRDEAFIYQDGDDDDEVLPITAAIREKGKDLIASVRVRKNKLNVYSFRGGGDGGGDDGERSDRYRVSTFLSPDASLSFFDGFGRSFCLILTFLASMNAFGRIIFHEEVFEEVSSRLLSEESASAIKAVQQIFSGFDDYGVVDVFKSYSTRDVILSILALSRLQSAVKHSQQQQMEINSKVIVAPSLEGQNPHVTDMKLLSDLAHYAVFANVAYGWKGGVFLSGRFHGDDLKTLILRTGIDKRDVVSAHWTAKTHRPAYFIVRDIARKKIVLCIRGTLSPRDVLTDLCCAAEEFGVRDEDGADCVQIGDDQLSNIPTKYRARAHQGMVAAARGVARMCKKTIVNELVANPGFNLVIVGHSLGGGTAAVLGTMWRETFPGLSVYAYGCPCVGPLDSYPTSNEDIISVVGEGDPFSKLSLGHIADLSEAIAELCINSELRDEILQRTKGQEDGTSDDNSKWFYNQIEYLTERKKTEKFFPPGRILYMGGAVFGDNGNVTLREVKPEVFKDLTLHSKMLDISRHVPNRYEAALGRLWENVKNNGVIN